MHHDDREPVGSAYLPDPPIRDPRRPLSSRLISGAPRPAVTTVAAVTAARFTTPHHQAPGEIKINFHMPATAATANSGGPTSIVNQCHSSPVNKRRWVQTAFTTTL